MRIATAEQMRQLDNLTIYQLGVPSLLLMERAAQGIAQACLTLLRDKESPNVVVLCGSGNNGGDGVAAARLLKNAGAKVSAYLVGSREKMTEDTKAMEGMLLQVGGELLPFEVTPDHAQTVLNADLIVDAIFGIGLTRPVQGAALQAITWMNESKAPVVSADIPSGIQADSGKVLGEGVRAAVTVTFTLPKAGHYVGKGGIYTGKLVIHDIGIPQGLVDVLETDTTAIDEELVRSFLPKRAEDGHKGTFGKDYILAGSVGFTGAPVLAAEAAMRTGAGLVHLGVPESIYQIAAIKCQEAMPYPLPDENGKVSAQALEQIFTKMEGCDCALIGPGLGRSRDITTLVYNILHTVNYPIILDADGLNAAADHIYMVDERRDCPTILTPHDGEFARLGGDLSDEERLTAARMFAMEHGCLLVLKGHRTIVALPDGQAFVNTTGNCGMAKGGSGDVLSGMILGLMGQGIHPVKATVAAVWLHGRAGDLAAEDLGTYAMTPSDLLRYLPKALREVTE
jgi:NAD(P)H-hydrate epimerase